MVAVNIVDAPDPIVAAVTALHFKAEDVDSIDETADFSSGSPGIIEERGTILHYLSAEHADVDDPHRSQVFAGDGEWQGWVPPVAGAWTVHLRKVEDDSSDANETFTAV